MSTEPENLLKHKLCKYLRSKEMFYDAPAEQDDEFSSGIFWCSNTETCLGPDGKPVDDETCGSGRQCYER